MTENITENENLETLSNQSSLSASTFIIPCKRYDVLISQDIPEANVFSGDKITDFIVYQKLATDNLVENPDLNYSIWEDPNVKFSTQIQASFAITNFVNYEIVESVKDSSETINFKIIDNHLEIFNKESEEWIKIQK